MKPYPFDQSQGDFTDLVFDSTDLAECLEYFEESGNIEPLRTAIRLSYKPKTMSRTDLRNLTQPKL